MLEAGDRTGKQIEYDLGIGSGQVYKWRKELAASGERAFPGHGTALLTCVVDLVDASPCSGFRRRF